MSLTLGEAQKALDAAIARANSLGVALSIAVVDRRGDLIASARMDGAHFFTIEVARGKAQVSAILGAPSGGFADMASSPIIQRVNELAGGSLIFHQGAVPLMKDGKPVGAVGGSGASAEQDEEAAKAGAATL